MFCKRAYPAVRPFDLPMFLCVSLNPAIDKQMRVRSLAAGQVIRAERVQGFPGGKAAHVAMVLRTLGHATRWTGLCGGSTGEELISGLLKLGIDVHHYQTSGKTRTNLEIIDDRGAVTEILEPGDAPNDREILAFEEKCRDLFSEGRENLWVIFSGSLPPGVAADSYSRLIAIAKSFGCSTCVDTGGEALRLALSQRPDFVKPNRDEAALCVGTQIEHLPEAASALRQLISKGARAAALSLGAEGMLYCAGDRQPVFWAPAVSVPVRSTVGCGDSALAGFLHSFALNATPDHALAFAVACAAANCLADSPGAARLQDIERLLPSVRVQRMSE
jgi:tagatose 6-phosphate kinase